MPLFRRRPPNWDETTSDEELVGWTQRGQREAFGLLYDRYLTRVYGYCYRLLGEREAAQDANSIVFTKALTALPGFRAGIATGTFRGWLFAIAHNVIADELRRYWDELVRGGPANPGEIDPALVSLIRQLHAQRDVAPPDSAYAKRLREDLMNQAGLVGATLLVPFPASQQAANGRTQPRGHARGTASQERRLWRFGPIATAALLLVVLGLAYLALGPLRPGPDRPRLIPAVVVPAATPGTAEATSTATPFPREGHAIIGVWEFDYEPWNPGHNVTHIVFYPDGTSIEYDDFNGIEIGRWRATGPRTVEFVFLSQHQESFDYMFEPGYDLVQPIWRGSVLVTGYRSIEIDESGNTFLATGYYEPRNADGSIIVHLEYDGQPLPGVRMVPVQTATPTP